MLRTLCFGYWATRAHADAALWFGPTIVRLVVCRAAGKARLLRLQSGERERCLNAGMDGYLTKPINEGALLTEIAERTKPQA